MAKVLVLDDDKDIQGLMLEVLSRKGYKVMLAGDGVEGLKKISEDRPDLIILDLMMPNMNGFEFYRQLKANENFNKIPVVVLSALRETDLGKNNSILHGIKRFFTKPFDMDSLLREVDGAIKASGNGGIGSTVIFK